MTNPCETLYAQRKDTLKNTKGFFDSLKSNYLAKSEQLKSPEKFVELNTNKTKTMVSKLKLNTEGKDFATLREDNKGGFFERLFNTTSPQYNELLDAIDAFNDPKNKDYGNLTLVENAAKGYLAHKLPEGTEFKDVGKTGQGRIKFCQDILKTISETRTAICPPVDMDEIAKNVLGEDDQEEFKEALGKDIEMENEKQKDVQLLDVNGNQIENNINLENKKEENGLELLDIDDNGKSDEEIFEEIQNDLDESIDLDDDLNKSI